MTATLTMGSEVQVRIGIDHGQFIACDADADLDIESYDETATREGLAIWGGCAGVTVFAASDWTDSAVVVGLSPDRPALAEDDWDHVVEGGLAIRSGRLRLYGPEDTGINEASIALPTGTYSLLVCGRGFDTTNEYGDEGDDTYALMLWPGGPLERRVIKDGLSWKS